MKWKRKLSGSSGKLSDQTQIVMFACPTQVMIYIILNWFVIKKIASN